MDDRDKELFSEKVMLHNWPECGPGGLSIEALYHLFRRRMEMDRHAENCELREPPYVEDGKVWTCTCGADPLPTQQVNDQ